MHKLFFFAHYIQIQHLLKLNNVPSLASEGAIIQIQHLLKLNLLPAVTDANGENSNTTLVKVKC